MHFFKVTVEQVRCAVIEIQADDFADARDKALRIHEVDRWCDGHSVEVIDIDRVMGDDE